MSIDAQDTEFSVVINDEEQYSIWPTYEAVPAGCAVFARMPLAIRERFAHGLLYVRNWRSAVIVNSLAGREVYRTEIECPPEQWHSSQPMAAEREGQRARGGIEV
ncbi:MAG TPA: MbtH family NRPS accessory protein [Polyangiales bacterium]|nr:MbtH family NRPS accessory protein [Polyangiales bacterium]